MTNKELINLLLDFPMESEVTLRLDLPDIELDYEQFEVETERYRQNDRPIIVVKIEKKLDQDIIQDTTDEGSMF